MKLKKSKKFTAILTSILITFTIYTGSLLIFLYVKGWRFDLTDQSVKQIGVLTVESTPTLADIYVDEVHKGRTNKSMTLDVGEYEVRVTKDGYYDWNKRVEILEEKSTPIFPYLIKTDPQSETLFESDLSLENYWVDKANSHLLLLLKNDDHYELLHYDINNGFWSLGSSTTSILTIPIDEEKPVTRIDMLLSPSGEKAVLELATEENEEKYIIPTTRVSTYSTVINDPLNLDDFSNYKINWSKDESYLILNSKEDILSYDFDKNTKYVLLKKNSSSELWDTDKKGYFYTFSTVKSSNEQIFEYTLKQYNLDGSSQTTVIPSIYFQKNTEYIDTYRADDVSFEYFTNSPECTQTIGEVTDFTIDQNVKGLYIKTTTATYWYNITTGKYLTVSPYPAELIQFAPDGEKLLIKTPTQYQVFVFDKEEGDHTITIGAHDIKNLNFDQIEKINWLSHSTYLQLEEDDFIYMCDKDGDNKTPLINNTDILYWTINSSREKLITLSNTEDKGTIITSYTIH